MALASDMWDMALASDMWGMALGPDIGQVPGTQDTVPASDRELAADIQGLAAPQGTEPQELALQGPVLQSGTLHFRQKENSETQSRWPH